MSLTALCCDGEVVSIVLSNEVFKMALRTHFEFEDVSYISLLQPTFMRM